MEQFIIISQIALEKLPGKEISISTIYRWCRKNKYPNMFKRIGGRVLVDIIELQRLLTEGEIHE